MAGIQHVSGDAFGCSAVTRRLKAMALLVLLGTWPVSLAHAALKVDCSPAKGVSFICGVTNVEDFAPVPDSKWVIGGDLPAASNPQGNLYLFDTGRKTATAVKPSEIAIRPNRKTYPGCPGPVDMKTFGPHGLDLSRTGGTHRVLYAVN